MKKKYLKPEMSVEIVVLETTIANSSVTPHFSTGAVLEEWEEEEVDLGKYDW